MSPGGVVVASEQIVKELRRATSQDLWLSFIAEKPVPSQRQVWAALDDANVKFLEDDVLVSADGPWPDPVEEATWTVLVNRVASEESLTGWLQAFAQGLEQAGLSGRVRYSKTPSYPALAVIDKAPSPQMTCFLAHTRSGPPDPPGHWDVSAEATHRICQQQAATAFAGSETYMLHVRFRRLAPAAAAAALERTLARDSIASIEHIRTAPPRFASTGFGPHGQSTRVLFDPERHWRDRLDDHLGYMKSLAEHIDVAFVQYAFGSHSWSNLVRGPLGLGYHEAYLWRDPGTLKDRVPDARGVLLVTERHLERATDLRSWNTTSLDGGRYLLAAASLDDWFETNVPNPEVLAQARTDFGDMIFRPPAEQ